MTTDSTTPRRRVGMLLAIALALLALSPNLVWISVADGKHVQHSVPFALMQGLLPSAAALVAVLAAFGRRLWLGYLVVLPFLPFVPAEIAYIHYYHEPSWYAIVATIAESNSREIVDFLGAALWPLLGACAASLVFGILAIAWLARTALAWTGRSRSLALVASISTIAVCVAAVMLRPADPSEQAAGSSGEPAFTTTSILKALVEPSFPVGVPVRYLHYRSEWGKMRDAAQRLASTHFGTHPTRPLDARQIYVLVIGETGRADRWQLYGYERATNPELARATNLIRLTDIITPQCTSRASVPIIVSRKRWSDAHDYFDERSIGGAFAEAGFDTYWLSNQMAVGYYESPIAVAAYDAAHVQFYSVADWTKPGSYDDVLLRPLREAIASPAQKLFIVLHTMGSHANYSHRYPEDFDHFKPSLKDIVDPDYRDPALRERIRNAYDNSILYTDHFIAEVIRTLAATNAAATMWYVSDHGEDFATDTCNFIEHGNGTSYEFRVPSVFWYSDAWASRFGSELDQFKLHSTARATTENIFESMIDMAALDFPGHDSTWSLFSSSWQPHVRMVRGYFAVDFDSAAVSENCHMVMPPGTTAK